MTEFEGPCLFYERPNANNRVYSRSCFKDYDGKTVPVTLGFDSDPIGEATLQVNADSVYCFGTVSTIPEELLKVSGLGLALHTDDIHQDSDELRIDSGSIDSVALVTYPADPDLKINPDSVKEVSNGTEV